MENVFVGAFPHTDRWLTVDNDHADNDLFEKVWYRVVRSATPQPPVKAVLKDI